MSDDNIALIISALNAKVARNGAPDFRVKFAMPGQTSIVVGPNGVEVGDGYAEVTLRVSSDNLAGVFSGRINPAMAFISGKIQVEGDHGKASKLKSLLL